MRALPKVHIVSACIGGLTLARCLRKKRIKAIISEENASQARHNYGISLKPQAYRALLNLVQLDESTFCQQVVVDATRGGGGQVNPRNLTRSSAPKDLSSPFRAHRRRLEALLQEKLEIKWGHMLEDITSYESEHFLSFKKKDNIHTRFIIYLESTPQSGSPYCLDHN